jgi:diguanylate cyclase (GGDEF)-like protein
MHTYKTWYTSHLQSIPRSFWYSLVFACTFLGVYAVWLFSHTASPIPPMLADTTNTLGSLTSCILCWVGVKRFYWKHHLDSASPSLMRRLHHRIPLILSCALFIQFIAYALLIVYDVYSPSSSTAPPFWSVVVHLGQYPFFLVGILMLPRENSLEKVPLRFLMESLVLITTLITFSWYFILGPNLFQNQEIALLGKVLIIGYPVFDLLVIGCLILLSNATANRHLRRAMSVLSLALLVFVFTDSILAYQALHGTPSDWLSLGWIVGDFMLALSLQGMRWQAKSQIDQEGSILQASALVATPMWRSLLSYALLPATAGLVFYVWKIGKTGPLEIGMYGFSLCLLLLIFIKQFFVIREIHQLNRGFQRLHRIIDEKNVALEKLATTDPLTELPNHRALVSVLDQEFARSQQYQRSCSLLFFDLDHFKALNDGYGHAGGDIALREFGTLLRTTLPVVNTVGRWGGEEFIAILPEQDAMEAVVIAEALRSAVAKHSFTIGGGMHLTCSIGVASFPTHGLQMETLLQSADTAMYGAKRLGRNQVRVIDDPAVIALAATNAAAEGRDELTLVGTVHALALLVEKRDMETGEHAQRVGELLKHLAQALGLSEAEAQHLSLAGQLHDIGKIVIPDSILQKRESLTEQELEYVYQHPQVGADVVSSIPSLRSLAPIIAAHHEWWNGAGYPCQLASEAIPLGARLLTLVDAYVSMTTNHAYGEMHGQQWAFDELRRGGGTQFDPAIVEPFLRMMTTRSSEGAATEIMVHVK